MAGASPDRDAAQRHRLAVTTRVLGIDPGLGATGYGVIEGDGRHVSLIDCGVVRTSPRQPRAQRLHRIHAAVGDLIERHRPHELAIEQQYVAENARSAMAIGEARAAAMVAAAAAGMEVFEFTPTAVKESVAGWGGAPKAQLAQMVMVQLGVTELPGPLDVSDALAIALARLADARFQALVAGR